MPGHGVRVPPQSKMTALTAMPRILRSPRPRPSAAHGSDIALDKPGRPSQLPLRAGGLRALRRRPSILFLTKSTFLLDYRYVSSGYVAVGTQLLSRPDALDELPGIP